MTESTPLEPALLPPGIRSRSIGGVNGLAMHVLEAGAPDRPLVVLLHGFPELAYSWRRVMPLLAGAGFYVVAPDQRGYGRTTGWDGDYDGDVNSFRLPNLVRDALALVSALGHRSAAAVVGHDFGSPVAACCALIRPDVFRAVALMSAPFDGPPALPFGTAGPAVGSARTPASAGESIHDALARLVPPRKHYQWYYATRQADADMLHAPQGLHAFLRAYFHMKSADWPDNRPHRLRGWTAAELAKLPTYYIMERDRTMPESVAAAMPSAAAIAACTWLPDAELALYAGEFARTGFQGGLQWYRCRTEGRNADLDLFSGRTIDVPAIFVAGKSDWGVYQVPGSVERMQSQACTNLLGAHLLDGAGHWVQQEQPEQVSALLLQLLRASVA